MSYLPAMFAHWVASTPDAPAVQSQSGTLSYKDLDLWSSRIAMALLHSGVAPGDRVAICLPRSPELVAAMLGIVKARAAYVPIDPDDPPMRVEHVLQDADPCTIIVADTTSGNTVAANLPRMELASCPQEVAAPLAGSGLDLAYLMYTSGSTGKPKAVMVEHRNIANLVTKPSYISISSADRVLHLAPAAFDAATFEVWGALLNGATVVVAPPGPLLPAELAALIEESGITLLWLTAALFHRQIDEGVKAFGRLRAVLSGGEVLSIPHVRRLFSAFPELDVINCYGPTECTTFSTSHHITAAELVRPSIPIGKPLQNASIHIVGNDGVELPDGQAGELLIAGEGVSRGYWRRPGLTAERFLPDPLRPGGRRYCSGDLARVNEDGNVDFLGRADTQVKLRGHRIEPGEVENAIVAFPGVDRAAVLLDTAHEGGSRLIGYVVPAIGSDFNMRALRRFLRDRLPDYMVPSALTRIDDLPVTANGKVDRKALQAKQPLSRP